MVGSTSLLIWNWLNEAKFWLGQVSLNFGTGMGLVLESVSRIGLREVLVRLESGSREGWANVRTVLDLV